MQLYNTEHLSAFIESALKEDIGTKDLTTHALINDKVYGKGHLIMKDKGIIAGVALAKILFKHFDKRLNINILIPDGNRVNPNDIVFEIEGPYASMITVERVMLNCMQRMSGIATVTHSLATAIAHTSTKILDTRKTTPLCRRIEKWAVLIGGGYNHRFGLYDEILVKNNHIDACGGIIPMLDRLKDYCDKHPNIPVVIECRNSKEWKSVLEKAPYVNRILLDNMTPLEIKEVVSTVKGKVLLESSGNIDGSNIVDYAETGVDFVSIGMITHSIRSLDMSMHIIDK